MCLDCILRVITTTRRCPFACTEIASILDVSALSLCFESTSKLEPTLAPTFVNRCAIHAPGKLPRDSCLLFVNRRAQELACEFAEKKLTRDAGFARVKELEQRISWQLKNIQTYAEALSSMTSKNAGLVKELNEMKVVNNAQSVDRGVSRVRLSLMKTEVRTNSNPRPLTYHSSETSHFPSTQRAAGFLQS